MSAPPSDRPCQHDFAQGELELAKWVAVVTMFVDHYGKIVDQSIFIETNTIGRLSFPLFAAIIGIRLAFRPALDRRYLRYLVPWAIVSQPVFVLVGRDWYDGNIFFTLALGVVATRILAWRAELPALQAAGSLALIGVASIVVDYGPIGVAMIPAMAHFVATRGYGGLAAAGPLGVAANVTATSPPLLAGDWAALLAAPVLMISTRAKIRLPRLPTQLFYAFYPGHLLALHFYASCR
jgi:hypothetical protein